MNTDADFNLDNSDRRFDPITQKIIGCAYKVANVLGSGFLEKVYEHALAHELRKAGFDVKQQRPINVYYDGVVIGELFADLVVNNEIIVELKAIDQLAAIHTAQCINYVTATGQPICLLINFSRRVEVKRVADRSLKSSS
jgi:GxxExxY protein